jgi:hypothetical protein
MSLFDAQELLFSDKSVKLFRLPLPQIDRILSMNKILFAEDRVINSYDRNDLLILLLEVDGIRAGFKVGYGQSEGVFYSAKGGVMPAFRRQGYARLMTIEMMKLALKSGYQTFEFDTFPNQAPEMLMMGLSDEFKVTDAGWNDTHNDFRIHLSVSISEYLARVANLRGTDDG